MNITLIKATNRKNSSTYNGAKYLISRLDSVGEVFEFTLPDDMPHICRGCYACLNGKEEKCGGFEYLKPINDAIAKSSLIIFCAPVWYFHAPGDKIVFRPLRLQMACSPSEFRYGKQAGGHHHNGRRRRYEVRGKRHQRQYGLLGRCADARCYTICLGNILERYARKI